MPLPPNLVTGRSDIDEQHAAILAELQRMRTLAVSEFPSALAFLRQHLATHFDAEERSMAEMNYPNCSAQHAEHLAFFDRFVLLKARIERDGFVPENVSALIQEVEEWVQEHVIQHDRRFAEYLRDRRVR